MADSAEGLSITSALTSQAILPYWLMGVEKPRDTTMFRSELNASHYEAVIVVAVQARVTRAQQRRTPVIDSNDSNHAQRCRDRKRRGGTEGRQAHCKRQAGENVYMTPHPSDHVLTGVIIIHSPHIAA